VEIRVGTEVIVKIPWNVGHIPPRYNEEQGVVTQILPKCKGFMFLSNGYDTPCFVRHSQILEVLT
jgi:hypothetical protein